MNIVCHILESVRKLLGVGLQVAVCIPLRGTPAAEVADKSQQHKTPNLRGGHGRKHGTGRAHPPVIHVDVFVAQILHARRDHGVRDRHDLCFGTFVNKAARVICAPATQTCSTDGKAEDARIEKTRADPAPGRATSSPGMRYNNLCPINTVLPCVPACTRPPGHKMIQTYHIDRA